MDISTNNNSGTVFDQIRTLQYRIDECRAACEFYRDEKERISEHLSAWQINSGSDNPDFVQTRYVLDTVCISLTGHVSEILH